MELELISSRLENKYQFLLNCNCSYYHSIQSILFDIQTILSNCQLYNEAESPLVKEATQMKEELFTSIQSIQQPPDNTPSFDKDEESTIQSVIEEIIQQIQAILQPYSSFLSESLPPYLITYCSKLYVRINGNKV